MEHFNTIDTSRCFYLGLKGPFPCTPEQLECFESSKAQQIMRLSKIFLTSLLPRHARLGMCSRPRGYQCPCVHEGDGAEVSGTGTGWWSLLWDKLHNSGILSCGSSNITLHPLFLFLWGEHRLMNDGCHFFKNKSQTHPYELHWMPHKPWKTSNISKEIINFYNACVW